MSVFLEAALRYLGMGLHPIPVEPAGKRPVLDSWEQYMERQPTLEEVCGWWAEMPDANVALVMGRGIMALDIDGPEGEAALVAAGIAIPPDAAMATTGKGRHIFFKVGPDASANLPWTGAPNRTGVLEKVDTRGDGGYVVAPPSIHPSGRQYTWITDISEAKPLPPALVELLSRPTKPGQGAAAESWVTQALAGVGEGGRDVTCTKLAGYFWGKGLPVEVVESLLQAWAARCTPAFPADQVTKCVLSISKREGGPEAEVEAQDCRQVVAAALALVKNPPRMAKTGLTGLDNILGGGLTPELIYMASRPSVGKTALALQIGRVVAKRGIGVLTITLEMLPSALMKRMFAQEAGIDATALKTGKLTPEEWLLLEATADRLGEMPMWITARARHIMQIENLIVRTKAAHPELGLVIIDYLQLIGAPIEYKDRRAVEYVSERLKAAVIENEVPILCLSSMSRPPHDAGLNWRPQLANLRESGELEHDADTVIFLHWDMATGEREVIVAKQRDGMTGTLRYNFSGQHQLFTDRQRALPPRVIEHQP